MASGESGGDRGRLRGASGKTGGRRKKENIWKGKEKGMDENGKRRKEG